MDASSSAALAAAAPKADDASTSTSATKRKAYNVLNLVLHAGRDLLVMDTKLMGKGSSDPQVKLAVGSEKVMSTCKKQNLNPAWDEALPAAAALHHGVLHLEQRAHALPAELPATGF